MNTAAQHASYATDAALLGHDSLEQRLLSEWNGGRMAHAYLFTGRRGIGKTTLAYRLAQFILNQEEKVAEPAGLFGDSLPEALPSSFAANPHSPASLRMAAGTHSGFMFLQPLFDEKKQQFKDEISVDQVRKITAFASQTAGEGSKKVILIEPAEAMNIAAANALLKWLEEPPTNTFFILVSHNPSRLLPTIRSRCRRLAFSPLTHDQCRDILSSKGVTLAGHASLLAHLSGGSIGILSELIDSQMDEVYSELLSFLLSNGSETLASYRFSESLPKRISWENWFLLMNETMGFIVKAASGVALPEWMGEDERNSFHTVASRLSAWEWVNQRDRLFALHRDTEQLYLDRKHVVMQMIDILAGKTTIV